MIYFTKKDLISQNLGSISLSHKKLFIQVKICPNTCGLTKYYLERETFQTNVTIPQLT
jgi:hypothetical protein